MKRYFLLFVRGVVGFGLLFYILSTNDGWAGIQKLFGTIWLLPCLVALVFFGAAIESLRMSVLFRPHHIPISFSYGYKLVAISALFNFCIPGGTGGDFVKGFYLVSENRKKGIEVATIILADRVVALFSLLILIVGLAVVQIDLVVDYLLVKWLVLVSGVGALLLLVGTSISWSSSFRKSRFFFFCTNTLPMGSYLKRMSDAIYVFRNEKTALFLAAVYSLVGHVALAGMFLATGNVFLGPGLGLGVCLLALLGMLANALPITPGGLGVGEAAFEGLFRGLGYEGGASLLVAWRIGMIPICIIGAIMYMNGIRNEKVEYSKMFFQYK